MNTKLKFIIENGKFSKSICAYLIIPNTTNESYTSSYININNNVIDLFEFATNFSLQNNITLKKERFRSKNQIKDTIIFDKGSFIITNFNQQLDILNPTLTHVSLKKKVIRGVAIGLSSAIIGTGAYLISQKLSNDKYANKENIESLTDDNVLHAGIAKSFNNVDGHDIPLTIESINPDQNEMELMQNDGADNVFSFEYEDRCNSEPVSNAKLYMDIFDQYGKTYGIDPNLLMAIMAQESGGVHHEYSDNGHAIGGMQIEDVWDQEKLTAFNFETNANEEMIVDINMLSDIHYNIKVAAMILQYNLVRFDYDIPKAIQAYNMGTNKVLSFGQDWVYERSFSTTGDSKYFEHVFSYLPDGYTISVMKPDRSFSSITINNLSNNYENSVFTN